MVSGIIKAPYRSPEKRVYDLSRGGQRLQNRQQVMQKDATRPNAEDRAEEERTHTNPYLNNGDHIDERA